MADIPKTLAALGKRGFKTFYFKGAESARAFLSVEIRGATVGMGGSMTLKELGLFELLSEHNTVYWHWATQKTPELMAAAQNAEVYLTGANALSESGEIVNIDGSGNRVSASIYGANRKRTIFVCGSNKIESTLEKAMWRAKNIAAPKNAQRLKLKTPCAVKGDKCYDCNSPQRICNAVGVLQRPTNGEMWVVIVDGDFGY